MLPSKIFEYAATGKPIIAGLSGFSKRFIKEEIDNVILFDQCDHLDLHEKLSTYQHRPSNHPGSPPGWVNNKIGNHVASRNHGINFSRETYTVGVFLQDIIEDGSGWRRQNFPDGLWGIWFRLNDNQKPLQAVTYEYLQTTLQSGPEYRENGEVVGGRDNYFNHGVYQSGWSYYSYTIGTPLISSPILNDPSVFSFTNYNTPQY